MITLRTFHVIAVTGLLALSSAPAFAPADMNKVLRVALPWADGGYDPQAADFFSNAVTRVIFDPLYTYDHLARPMKLVSWRSLPPAFASTSQMSEFR